MNEQVEDNDKYTVLERFVLSTNNGDFIAADALGKVCLALKAKSDDAASEQWVATMGHNCIVFERRLWL